MSDTVRSVASEGVTPDMVDDCKRLLAMLGVPWIQARALMPCRHCVCDMRVRPRQAPFEAEAQCAALELAGLVDGVVTDDSDALLFGYARARACVCVCARSGVSSLIAAAAAQCAERVPTLVSRQERRRAVRGERR
jgi:hypothetical protein